VTTRIHLHKGRCPCRNAKVATTPSADTVPGTPFGPGTVALVTRLHACQMVTFSRMTEQMAFICWLPSCVPRAWTQPTGASR
jgi:hypothetical protein